eukprot:1160745-Pelagomonas_calceolata.AAC.1
MSGREWILRTISQDYDMDSMSPRLWIRKGIAQGKKAPPGKTRGITSQFDTLMAFLALAGCWHSGASDEKLISTTRGAGLSFSKCVMSTRDWSTQ